MAASEPGREEEAEKRRELAEELNRAAENYKDAIERERTVVALVLEGSSVDEARRLGHGEGASGTRARQFATAVSRALKHVDPAAPSQARQPTKQKRGGRKKGKR